MIETTENSPDARPERARKFRKTRVIAAITLGAAMLLGIGIPWYQHTHPAAFDPFDAKTIAAMKFPIYYPTNVPQGYRVDGKSVSLPQAGVVSYRLVGPDKQMIYVTQEARPNKFDLGGFYKKFSGLHEIAFEDGAIATGELDSGRTEISSRNTNKTWILVTTQADVPLDQLTNMLKGFVPAH
jgi:hypothetical protein